MKNNFRSFLGLLLIVFLVVAGFPFSTNRANAAALTHLSDTQTNQTMGALSSHAITFVNTTAITSSATTTLVFNNATTIAGITSGDIALFINGVIATTTVGAAAAATWGFAFTASTVTITAPTAGTPAVASTSILIDIGTAATSTAVNRITNFASATTTILTITTSVGDTAQIALPVITNSIVNITATVAPSITFSIDANALQFGTLTSGAARWATTTAGGSPGDVSGNQLQIATNSTSGYNITLQGSTLTASTGSITPITGSPAASSPGSPQFGLYALETGGATTATTTANYRTSGTYYFGATATSTDTLGVSTGPTSTATYNVHYIANISGSTPSGAYATNITYIATPLF